MPHEPFEHGEDCQCEPLQERHFENVDYEGAFLASERFNGLRMKRANFRKAVLVDADFECAQLQETIFTDASLVHANFHAADLRGANLEDADLRDADLKEAMLSGAALMGARYNESTRFPCGFDPRESGLVLVAE